MYILSGYGTQYVKKNHSIKVHRVTNHHPTPTTLFFFLKKKKKKKTFNFSQTGGEMVFVSFEVETMRMFLVQSVVRWCWVFVRSWGAVVSFPV